MICRGLCDVRLVVSSVYSTWILPQLRRDASIEAQGRIDGSLSYPSTSFKKIVPSSCTF